MKKNKTLIIYYVILLLLSFISLMSFKQKGNDLFIAISSITADISLIFSTIIIVYSIMYCLNSFKNEKKHLNKNIIKSLLILLLTIIIIFISFINIFAHKNIIEYLIRVINKKENLDIISLFVESLFVFYFIYLGVVNGIMVKNCNKKTYIAPLVITILITIISIIFIILDIKLLYYICFLDIIFYISIIVLLKNVKE